jgi:hypothetical protein
VVPPLVLGSAVPPLVPVVWSHARKVIADAMVPLKFKLGRKRIRVWVFDASKRALVAETLPSALQLLPLSDEYCHEPLAVSAAMTAIPSTAPASTSVIRSPPALAMMSETSVPALAASSSAIEVNDILPALSSTGASLTAVTLIVKVWAALVSMPPLAVPPLSCSRTVIVAEPFALAAGV